MNVLMQCVNLFGLQLPSTGPFMLLCCFLLPIYGMCDPPTQQIWYILDANRADALWFGSVRELVHLEDEFSIPPSRPRGPAAAEQCCLWLVSSPLSLDSLSRAVRKAALSRNDGLSSSFIMSPPTLWFPAWCSEKTCRAETRADVKPRCNVQL